jgi:hypothetical protein
MTGAGAQKEGERLISTCLEAEERFFSFGTCYYKRKCFWKGADETISSKFSQI